MADYHSTDFIYEEWALQAPEYYAQEMQNSPDILNTPDISLNSYGSTWDAFYSNQGSSAYKLRRYLETEFKNYLRDSQESELCIIDVGAGVGSCSLSLLETLRDKIVGYINTDCSEKALEHLASNLKAKETIKEGKHIDFVTWDITTHSFPGSAKIERRCNVALSIFTLSAIHPSLHEVALYNIKSSLRDGSSHILFRDYALHDMTQYRHKVLERKEQYYTLCERKDGTFAFFFTSSYFEDLVRRVGGLRLVEGPSYACVINKNRRTGQELRRVFLHAVIGT